MASLCLMLITPNFLAGTIRLWVGGYISSGTWYWQSGATMASELWGPEQPNEGSQNRVIIWDFEIHDVYDVDTYNSVCEYGICLQCKYIPWYDDGLIRKCFPHYWPFVKEIHWSVVDSPCKEPVVWRVDIFLDEKYRLKNGIHFIST